MDTTIAAIATPQGTGGIGIVRISGAQALAVAGRIFRANSGKKLAEMHGYQCALGKIYDGKAPLDDAICTIFCTPKSYTGEDVAELSCHGGALLVQQVLRLCLQNGAQPAAPGEFTKRAFLNGKLGLTQAEAVMDLISAQGQSAIKAAFSARQGALAASVGEITAQLITQSAHLAAWADYPDEDLQPLDRGLLKAALQSCLQAVENLLATYDRGKILRQGVLTAIIGKPNVGKSTLMNLLTGQESSIVTDIPGTTRDIVQDQVRLGDCVLNLCDTAGIHETADLVERVGVQRAKSQLTQAELVLAVFDSAAELSPQDRDLLTLLADKPCIAILNKMDLPQKLALAEIEEKIPHVLMLSAKTGQGREQLEQAITQALGLSQLDPTAALVANERQRQCLIQAKTALEEAQTALLSQNMLDAVGACVDFALDRLLELTGERASERVVEEVFARFCVGK